MDEALLDSLAQSMLESGGFDFPLSNGDLDFSLPADLYGNLPHLESLSNGSSGGQVIPRAVITPCCDDAVCALA